MRPIPLLLLVILFASSVRGSDAFLDAPGGGKFVLASTIRPAAGMIEGELFNQTGAKWEKVTIHFSFSAQLHLDQTFTNIEAGKSAPFRRTGLLQLSSISGELQADIDLGEAMSSERRINFVESRPFLQSGGQVVFLASDEKCAAQFEQARKLDGLEARKRIAELLAYDCGSLLDSPGRVEVIRRGSVYTLVRFATGKHEGQQGWVPIIWLGAAPRPATQN